MRNPPNCPTSNPQECRAETVSRNMSQAFLAMAARTLTQKESWTGKDSFTVCFQYSILWPWAAEKDMQFQKHHLGKQWGGCEARKLTHVAEALEKPFKDSQVGLAVLKPHKTMGEAASSLLNITAHRWKETRLPPEPSSLHYFSSLSSSIDYCQVLLSTPGNSCASVKKHFSQPNPINKPQDKSS